MILKDLRRRTIMSKEIEELEICNSCLKLSVKAYSKLRSKFDIMVAGIDKAARLLDGGVCELAQDEDRWFIHNVYDDVYIISPTLKGLIMQLGRMR